MCICICIYIYIYIYVHTHIHCITLLDQGRRQRRLPLLLRPRAGPKDNNDNLNKVIRYILGSNDNNLNNVIRYLLGKDKGGPSKGGFLNDRSFSHTVPYLCNEINGVYQNNRLLMNIIDYSGNHLY